MYMSPTNMRGSRRFRPVCPDNVIPFSFVHERIQRGGGGAGGPDLPENHKI